ncbi:unnamed protein product [Somion occarium]|uniref:non-specific serine/threonine protein kinase n=1 Tax=Somion occarium TaxID=3059160 RepID=A0ABP1DS22_9APHY
MPNYSSLCSGLILFFVGHARPQDIREHAWARLKTTKAASPPERGYTYINRVPLTRKRQYGDAKSRRAALVPPIITALPSITPIRVSTTPCFPEPPSVIDGSYSQHFSSEAEHQLRLQLSIISRKLPTPQELDDEDECPHCPRVKRVGSPDTLSSASTTGPPQTPGDHETIDPAVRQRLGSISQSRLYQIATSEIFPPSKNSKKDTTPKVGPFAILHELDHGSYASAFAARDLATSRVICTKVFSKKRTSERQERYVGLLTELIAYQHISSVEENARKWLMELHGVVQDTRNVIYVMDLMECDLFSLLRTPIKRPLIKRWIAQIALAIDSLHKMGIMHRDVKPENILLVPGTENVRLTDFTNAWISPLRNQFTISQHTEPLHWYMTYSSHHLGTREYLAPEMHSKQRYGLAVDWWALGCVLFDLLVGDVIFPDAEAVAEYVRWRAGGKEASDFFTKRSEALLPADLDLLCGLLTVDTRARYRLKSVEASQFFASDKNLFDSLRKMTSADICGETKPSPEELEFYASFKDTPINHAKPERPGKKLLWMDKS